jgi:acetyl esterase/lipase
MSCQALLPLALAVGLAVGDTTPTRQPPPFPGAVKEVRDIPYFQGDGADPVRHRLDLYLPAGKRHYPVLLLVHGGAWVVGDRTFFGWGPALGRYFASRGIGVVMPSYRLSPRVKHPEHVKDVARAFAWTARNIGEYGGSTKKLFLCGHSAGGHLVSLLATDPAYLQAEGLSVALVQGVISVSGVYRIPALNLAGLPWQGVGGVLQSLGGGLRLPLFGSIFGDAKTCASASPVNHVRAGLPPFLLINAEHDLPLLPQMAREFARALTAAGDNVEQLCVKGRGHEDVMFDATRADDPVARAIEQFVRAHLTGKKGERR